MSMMQSLNTTGRRCKALKQQSMDAKLNTTSCGFKAWTQQVKKKVNKKGGRMTNDWLIKHVHLVYLSTLMLFVKLSILGHKLKIPENLNLPN